MKHELPMIKGLKPLAFISWVTCWDSWLGTGTYECLLYEMTTQMLLETFQFSEPSNSTKRSCAFFIRATSSQKHL